MRIFRLLVLSVCVVLSSKHAWAAGAFTDVFGASITLSYSFKHLEKGRTSFPKTVLSIPGYPAELLRLGIGGKVQFECAITADGTTDKITITRSTDPAFGAIVEETIRAWIFVPLNEGDRSVQIKGTVLFVPTPGED